jgi:hypothetical protein
VRYIGRSAWAWRYNEIALFGRIKAKDLLAAFGVLEGTFWGQQLVLFCHISPQQTDFKLVAWFSFYSIISGTVPIAPVKWL